MRLRSSGRRAHGAPAGEASAAGPQKEARPATRSSAQPRDEARRTALHWNAHNGHGGATQRLVSSGCDVEALDHAGRSALYIAAAGGNESVARCLVRNGAGLGARCPLEAAAANPRSLGVARLLLAATAAGGRPRPDRARLDRALHTALDSGNLEAARLLLASGADANSTRGGLGCVERVFAWPSPGGDALLELLLAAGARLDARGASGLLPIHAVAATGEPRALARLVRAGARLDAEDAQGATALHHAVASKDPRPVRLLLAEGARPEPADRQGDSPLHYAALHYAGPEIGACLLGRGARPDRPNRRGQTPTHLAAAHAGPELVRLFAGRGADFRARDRRGRTVLHYALEGRGALEVARIALDAGADVNAAALDGVTPLHLAAGRADLECLRLLVRRGARLDARDARRRSAVHYCIDGAAVFISGKSHREQRLRCVEALLDSGLDANGELAREGQLLRRGLERGEPELASLVLEALVVAELKGLRVGERDVGLVAGLEQLGGCYEERKAELLAMKGKRVLGRLSLLDLVTLDARRLARYAKSIPIDDVLDYCQSHFPAHRERLKTKIHESLRMKAIIDDATLVLADVFQFANFSVEICEEILSKMDTQHLGYLQAHRSRANVSS